MASGKNYNDDISASELSQSITSGDFDSNGFLGVDLNDNINSNGTKGTPTATIPQIHRIPVFSELLMNDRCGSSSGKAGKRNAPSSNSRPGSSFSPSRQFDGVHVTPSPSRPETGRPKSRGAVSSQSANLTRQVNLENRILIRLANVLPHDGAHSNPAAYSTSQHAASPSMSGVAFKLPESRNYLMKINQDLDEIIGEVRLWGLVGDKFVLGDLIEASEAAAVDGSNTTIALKADINQNNPTVIDSIIVELSQQASKKVSRIKKSFRAQISRMNKNHEEETQRLQFELEKTAANLRLLQIKHCETDIDVASAIPGTSVGTLAGLSRTSHDRRSPSPSTTQAQTNQSRSLRNEDDKNGDKSVKDELHRFVSETLDHERKITTEKLISLASELQKTQAELRESKETIKKLNDKLLDKEMSQMDRERVVIGSLRDTIKTLLNVQKQQLGSSPDRRRTEVASPRSSYQFSSISIDTNK